MSVGYALTVRNSRGESRDVIAPTGATHAIVDQLTPSTTYFVKVSLNNKFGKTSTSETAALFTTEGNVDSSFFLLLYNIYMFYVFELSVYKDNNLIY